jgi:hypothetical protein
VVQADTGGLSAVRITNPCDDCSSGGCWQVGSSAAAGSLFVAVTPAISGRIGGTVAISVSRSGLTRISLLLFGPMLLALATLAVASHQGISDGWLSGLAVVLMTVALGLSQTLLKHRIVPLLDLDACEQT